MPKRSRENLEIVRSIYARWENGDFAATDWAAPDIEFTNPEGKRASGHAGMASRWRDWLETVDGFAVLPEKYIEVDEDRVLVLTRFSGQGTGSGAPLGGFPGGSLFTLRDGKVARLALFSGTRQALEAAGLSEEG